MATPADRHLQVYAFLAAAAALSRSELGILLGGVESPNVLWTTYLYLPFAFALLLRPWDLRLLLALFATQLVDLWNMLPMSPNHWLLTGIVAIGWLATAAQLSARHGRLPTGGELLEAAAPALRPAIAVFYVFTGIWKTNWTFLDPELSCGVQSWHRLSVQLGVPEAPWIASGVIAFTLLLEYGGGLLLLPRVTRPYTAVFLAFFHAVLALDLLQNYQNFSWTMYPLLWLMIEPGAVERLLARLPAVERLVPLIRAMWAGFWVLAALVALFVGSMAYWKVRWAFAAPMAWLWTAAFAWAALPSARSRHDGWRPAGAAWLTLALIVLNGMSPVLGLKNRNSWQMYSNVRLEADASNHLLFGRSLDLLGNERDRVEVLATSDELLASEVVGQGLRMTWHDFRVRLARIPGATVEYSRNGALPERTVAGEDPALAPPGLLARKLVWYRPIGPAVAEQCAW